MYSAFGACKFCKKTCGADRSTDTIRVDAALLQSRVTEEELSHMWRAAWQAEAVRTAEFAGTSGDRIICVMDRGERPPPVLASDCRQNLLAEVAADPLLHHRLQQLALDTPPLPQPQSPLPPPEDAHAPEGSVASEEDVFERLLAADAEDEAGIEAPLLRCGGVLEPVVEASSEAEAAAEAEAASSCSPRTSLVSDTEDHQRPRFLPAPRGIFRGVRAWRTAVRIVAGKDARAEPDAADMSSLGGA
mmetsp:Transcript_12857/g.37009  ORF Transcript_12857/g.37009 Transcript_12857/m.37009 type:complete len:246 (+) Transcript_12857:64-801(+)